MKPKVIIEVSGGCVRDVSSDVNVDVMVIDYDVEGADEEALVTIPITGDVGMCQMFDADVKTKQVRNLYNEIKRELGS